MLNAIVIYMNLYGVSAEAPVNYGLTTDVQIQMNTPFFRSFVLADNELARPVKIESDTFDENTPIVVAEFNDSQAGELPGVSKVKGGNRMVTTRLASICGIFRARKQKRTRWSTV